MSDTVIQYRTNNDGTAGQLLSGSAVPQEVKQAARDALNSVSSDNLTGSPLTQFRDALENVLEEADDNVFISKSGSYYLSKLPKAPADMLIEYPAPALLSLLKSVGSIDVEDARDVIFRAANAGFLGDTAEHTLFLQSEMESVK